MDKATGASIVAWSGGMILLVVILAIWSVIWKAWALWRAARNNHLAWYIVMLLINTAGILEIIYIFAFSNYGKKQNTNSEK